MDLADLEALVRARRSTRKFSPRPVERELLERLLATAQWAPNGFNLQATLFTVVTREDLRQALLPACFGQKQVAEAPAVVVFSGDRRVLEHHFEDVLRMDRACGGITEEYEKFLRHTASLSFRQGPLGLNWLWKAALLPLVKFFVPTFDLPAVHKKLWLTRQAGLPVMTYLLAAEAAGLATVAMEGFCPRRVARILQLPAHELPIFVVPTGYAEPGTLRKSRLPLERVLRWR